MFDGVPTLMLRAANMRANEIVDASVNISLARFEISPEGEEMRRMRDLKLTRSRSSMFALSWTIFHPIDEDSPLFDFSLEDWDESVATVTVSISGVDGTFNQTIYARHTYSASDIVKGERFVDVITPREDGVIEIDYAKFHDTEPA